MKNYLKKTGSIILLSSISLSLVACSSETKEPSVENQKNTVKKIDDEKRKEIQREKALLANKIAKEKAKEKREKVKLKKAKQKDLKKQRLLAQQEKKEQKTLSGLTKKRNKSSSGKNSKSSSDNTTKTTQKSTQTQEPSKSFKNCDELRTVYSKGIPSSHPAYQAKMDRDKDGWACEISK